MEGLQCPSCGAEVPEGAQRCPSCSEWLAEGGPASEPNVEVRPPLEPRAPTDRVAIAALVCAGGGVLILLGPVLGLARMYFGAWCLLLAPLAGLVGLVLGIISLVRRRRCSYSRLSLGFSIAALVVGAAITLLVLGWVVLALLYVASMGTG